MSLTITIPGAVETTTGSTAPAVLTVGVGAPGVGVPSGGTTGQVLKKLSGVSYDTGWLTLPADYITSVTAPLAVTAGNLAVDLSDYLPVAGGAMDTDAEVTIAETTGHDSELAGWGLGVQLSADHTKGTTVEFDGLDAYDGASHMQVTPTGLTFPDSTVQTTAAISGDRYLTSSTTSNTISNTTKTFTIGTDLSYTPTQNITISYDASNHMHGEVLTYSTSTGVLTVDINHHTGSGTYAAWVVNVGGVTPATSVAFADITGAVSGNANLQAALDLKANLASPTFTGTPTLPTGTIATTQTALDSSTKLATTAFVTTADNLKANLASPTFTGTPLSTTASVSTNTTQIATTAFVLGQVGTATPIVNGTAAVGTSLLYSRQDHVHGTDTTRAALASPTFTGTPTLPTGTIATTQSPGNNTTALATTAFVTAAVPAFASILNTSKQTSTTTAQNPASLLGITFSDKGVLVPMSSAFATATSGAGASASLYYGALLASTPITVAGYAGAYYATGTHYNGLTNRDIVDWTKTVGFSCVTNRESTAFPSGVLIRITLGKSASGGTLATRGIGLEIISGQTFVKILTHDGTTLTTTNSTYPLATNLTSNYVHQMSVISYGNGTAELFVDGVSYGTASGAPTTASTGTQNRYSIETYADGTQGATPLSQLFAHNKIITSL